MHDFKISIIIPAYNEEKSIGNIIAQLKSLYEDIINQEAGENDKGAGLGLITMALRTKNDISYSFTSLDGDQSFFKMQIIING